MMHNTNLMYSIYPVKVEEQDVLETFFVNTLWKDHKMNKGDKGTSFMVDNSDCISGFVQEGMQVSKTIRTCTMPCTKWK